MSRQSSATLDLGTVRHLLSPLAGARTRGGIAWRSENNAVRVGTVEVHTAMPQLATGQLRLHVRPQVAPAQPHVQYLMGGAAVRRACVNERHRPYPGTHKHRINPLARNGEEDAYEPDDLPAIALQPRVAPSLYRELLVAFAAECVVDVADDFVWLDP